MCHMIEPSEFLMSESHGDADQILVFMERNPAADKKDVHDSN